LPRQFTWLVASEGISLLGTSISALAIQLLLVGPLGASAAEIGAVRAAQFAPYLLIGILAGVWVDRVRRRPVLIASDLLLAVVFALIGGLAMAGRLGVPMLALLVFIAGGLSCVAIAANQSFIPRVVPTAMLPAAFGRLAVASSASESVGPFLAGALVRFVSAPFAILVDALTFLVSARLLSRVRIEEPPPDRSTRRSLRAEVTEGARWVYGHRELGPCALWLHAWFVSHTMLVTVQVYYATVELGLGPLVVGLIVASSGVVGALLALLVPWLAERGVGRVTVWVELASPLVGVAMLLARPGPTAIPMLVASQVLFGFGVISGSLMMGWRNAVTPDHLRARMNGTIRTFNWGGLAVSSLVAGVLATTFGTRCPIVVGTIGLALATAYLWRSPYRKATMPDPADLPV
jgi:MFS family permease